MANGNPFFVDPMGDHSRALGGLGSAIANFGQQREEKEKKERAEQRFIAAQKAAKDAISSQDPDQMRMAVVEFPELQKAFQMDFSFANNKTKEIVEDGYARFLADPSEETLALTMEAVRDSGGSPDRIMRDILDYRKDPEGTLNRIKIGYAGMADDQSYAEFKRQEEAKAPDYKGEELDIKRETLDIRREESRVRQEQQALAREDNALKREEMGLRIEERKNKIEQSKVKISQANSQAADAADSAIATVDRLLNHPGLESAVGTSSALPTIPGTDKANFEAELESFDAQIFSTAVKQMKGLGSLSEAEGRKISAAVGAIKPSMSEKRFKESLGIIREGFEKAKKRSGVKDTTKSTKKESNVPAIGEESMGYRFLGGDPALTESWEKI